ncbi:FtsB family cell division protein [Kitasatospora cheerisanensis]|uniref:Putative cell division protein FtsL n=1 Tax=Kitasatospora cheerisanensis KCTC 2395 TaxID=1348663 RepID=A0A066Z7N5_9ACTN|nr:cell division protein FtsL [Kitasatospora cheerisanensis]KDN86346.1 putative cell division protein FtsL [Kitasatospora cheerisanensis KCTC 2395]
MRGRTPFAVLVVTLLSAGLLGLLMLNTALNEGSFTLSRLKKQTTEATDQQQSLQQDIAAQSAPDALEQRARELGMVPGGDPVFLGADGSVTGKPKSAEDNPPVPRSSTEPWQRPAASGSPSPSPGAGPATPASTWPRPAPRRVRQRLARAQR